MIALQDALEIVLCCARPLEPERVALCAAQGRILAEDVVSDMDMPPFDKSLVDGYACRRADLAGELTVIETVPAGAPPTRPVGPGQCAKVMTGAAVSEGADCVVMVEQTEPVDAQRIRLTSRQTRDNLACQGSDIRTGQVVLRQGGRLSPPHIAVLASVGCVTPRVARRPVVGLITGGDELVDPGVEPGPSQIRDSNRAQLAAQLESMGAAVQCYELVRDSAAQIDRTLKVAMCQTDVVLISGGVSVGDFDFVPARLRQNKVDLKFEKIAVKPGKPTLFGVSEKGFCFGLPGNPVSTWVTFELLVKPFLYRLMGHDYAPVTIRMPLGASVTRKDTDRQSWIPVEITDGTSVRPVAYHGSAHILALCQADGLIAVPTGVARLETGTHVSVRLL